MLARLGCPIHCPIFFNLPKRAVSIPEPFPPLGPLLPAMPSAAEIPPANPARYHAAPLGGKAGLRHGARPGRLNRFDVMHDGAPKVLVSVVMARAARSAIPGCGAVTVGMKTCFMPAAQGPLVARERGLLHRVRGMAFGGRHPRGAAGWPCCHATGNATGIGKYVMSEVIGALVARRIEAD